MIDICRNYKHYHINVWQSRENLLVPFMFLLMIRSLSSLTSRLALVIMVVTGASCLPDTRDTSGISLCWDWRGLEKFLLIKLTFSLFLPLIKETRWREREHL